MIRPHPALPALLDLVGRFGLSGAATMLGEKVDESEALDDAHAAHTRWVVATRDADLVKENKG